MAKPAKIVVFDLDGTITQRDTYLPFLFGLLRRKPWIALRLYILPFAVAMYYAGLRNNTWLKKTFLKAFMKGLKASQIDQWVEDFTDQTIAQGLRDGALSELEKHKQANACILLVSASLDIYVNRFAEKLGFHATLCTQVEWDEKGRLTGSLATENCYAEEKIKRLHLWLQEHGGEAVDVAYSDHHSDIALLNFAEIGVAVSPSKKLAEIIRSNHLKLVNW